MLGGPRARRGAFRLTWQIGTAYFGCRGDDGAFSRARFLETLEATQTVRAIEIKISQGAEPGIGACSPQRRSRRRSARCGASRWGRTASAHPRTPRSTTRTRRSTSQRIAAASGLPVGANRVVFIGAGKLGIPQTALLAFAMGCDAVNVGREAMLAIGCIQAQRCHTGRCPTGVTTHSRWLMRGLDPELKSVRAANHIAQLRRELLELSRACGTAHPALVTLDDFEVLGDRFDARPAREVFGYEAGWGMPSIDDRAALGDRAGCP